MALCNITGTVYLPNGMLAVNREIVFRRVSRNITPEYLGAVLPDDVVTTTDGSGNIDVDLLTGSYMAFADGQPNDYFGKVTVPDAASATFASVLLSLPPPAPSPDWYDAIIEDIESLKQASSISSAQFGSPLNGVDDDAPAIQAAMDFAVAEGVNRVVVSGSPFVTNITIPGEIDVTFEGPVTAIGTTGFAVTVAPGFYARRAKIHGLSIIGNADMDGGLLLEAAQYWTIYDPVITGFAKPGAWAMVLTGDIDNRNSSSNTVINPNFSNCNNFVKFGKNPEIVGSQNTGASFNTFVGGFLGIFGDNTDNLQYGVLDEVGEANKFFNTRVATDKHHTICWEVMDARTQLIGCAGDGPCFTAFVYPLGGTGTVNTITLLGTPLLTTPVAWAGSRMATSEAIVAQIEADGNQHPATEFLAVAHDEQVMFFRVDANGNKVRLSTAEFSQIAVTSTGMTVGNSSINQGLLQGPPYTNYRDVTINKWGYQNGHGGVMEVYGFRYRANPEGSGRGGGSLYEPEGNGPRNIVWFDDVMTQRSVNVFQAGLNVLSGPLLTDDAVMINVDGGIRASVTTGNVTITHSVQRLRLENFGSMVFAEFLLRFTPTVTTNGLLYIELPQELGLHYKTDPLDVNGLRYNIPVTISGTNVTDQVYLTLFGGQLSPNGLPFGRLISSVGGGILSSSIFTSGQQVEIQGWGNWPVNRFV